MEKNTKDFLPENIFKTIIDSTPLVSLDFIVKKNNKILLGKRINRPAYGYWFTLGGRVLKNEMISDAIKRLFKIELGSEIITEPKFLGIFEHFYSDSIYNSISTHYINLGYEVNFPGELNLPTEQHDQYKWFSLEEILTDKNVHPYVKDYFTKELGTIPHNKH